MKELYPRIYLKFKWSMKAILNTHYCDNKLVKDRKPVPPMTSVKI